MPENNLIIPVSRVLQTYYIDQTFRLLLMQTIEDALFFTGRPIVCRYAVHLQIQ